MGGLHKPMYETCVQVSCLFLLADPIFVSLLSSPFPSVVG